MYYISKVTKKYTLSINREDVSLINYLKRFSIINNTSGPGRYAIMVIRPAIAENIKPHLTNNFSLD